MRMFQVGALMLPSRAVHFYVLTITTSLLSQRRLSRSILLKRLSLQVQVEPSHRVALVSGPPSVCRPRPESSAQTYRHDSITSLAVDPTRALRRSGLESALRATLP